MLKISCLYPCLKGTCFLPSGKKRSLRAKREEDGLRAWVCEIMSENIFYDCIVVGGGPGGSTAAAMLSKKGRRVLLLDKEKFPRDKTCGDAISGKSLAVLEELGLVSSVERSDHGEISGVLFSSPNGAVASIPFGKREQDIGKGYTCRRQVYDNLLFQNAKRGCDAMEGMAATALVKENGKVAGVKARGADGKEYEFRGRMVIGADGVNSVVAREIRGVEVDPAHTCIAYRAYYSGISGMTGCLEIHFVKSIMPGYFWIFPLEGGIANVGVGMVMEDMKRHGTDLGKAMEGIVKNNPLFKERFANARMVSPLKAWQLPFGSKKRKVHAENVLLVGDAAGLVDPFSGEGIGNAMLSGKIAADVAYEALVAGDTSEQFLSRYDERLWKAVWNELSTSYRMQQLGKVELLLNFVVGKAAKSPKAREAIAGTLANKEAKGEYASPLFYLKLLFE
ncbi:MAG: geranylgeranyl reductase family protein [Candidatus Micrarchaeota archaeon]|nr:geranylgeranyl reductase family protein [Candidatus Micrarchaeota archaeon]